MTTDRTSFPTTRTVATTGVPTTDRVGEHIGNVLISGHNVASFKVGATAVKAGQVVSISDAGLDFTVIPCIAEAGSMPIGVAIGNAAPGYQVAVAMLGCIARVSNFSSTDDIDAGDPVTWNDAAPGGTVILAVGAATQPLVGRMLVDSDASALDLDAMLVLCGATVSVHAA